MKENGFETLIVRYLVDNNHYEEGLNSEYNKTYAIDEGRLFRFLNDTQYKKMQELRIEESEIEKKKFLDRLSRKLSDDGVINIIRKGVKYKNHTLDFYMVQPSDGNVEAAKSYNKNIFSVTRQLRYSGDYGKLALDLCIFLNGLPIITMELKNQYTKQNYSDAIKQYKTDRTPDELLFQFKRCIVHFAVDDNEVHMCTELKRDKSFFLPFNKGNNNGAGNPNNPNGIKTDYLWKDILAKDCLANILENYVQITEEKDEDTGHKSYKQIFPRYHQLSVVTSLLADAKKDGPGHRYLIQHSAGSGKSNSIAWLAHQLVTLQKDKKDVFDTIIVVTDRINLDKQIRDTIKQFMQVSSTVGWAKDAATLKNLMDEGKKIIITNNFSKSLPQPIMEFLKKNVQVHNTVRMDGGLRVELDKPLTRGTGLFIHFPDCGFKNGEIVQYQESEVVDFDENTRRATFRFFTPDNISQDTFNIWLDQSVNKACLHMYDETFQEVYLASRLNTMYLTQSTLKAQLLSKEMGKQSVDSQIANMALRLDVPVLW